MANQITVNSGTGNITVTTSRAVIGTVANVASANYANFAGEAFDVSGSNVTGAVANATFATTAGTANTANTANTATSATTAGTVTTNAQPNITSVGTLSNLTVSNTITTNNLVVTGNFSVGNLVANNANYANFAGNAFAVAGANVSGTVANATFATTAGSANTANSATVANSANAVAGANVSGTVANATYADNAGNANFANSATVANSANSVTLANVSGAGNIAGINLDGNVSNLLTGNGTFVAIPTGGGNTDNISNGTSNVSIPTANANIEVYANTQHWTFADDGNLILAGGNGVIQSIANSSLDPLTPNASTMKLTPDQNYTSQALVLDPTTPGHIHLRAPGSNIDQPLANIYLGGEQSSFEVGVYNGAAPNLFVHSGNNTWGFDNTGNLTLPGNTFAINYANGNAVPIDNVANANYANFAGNAYAVDGANVSGAVANATFALDAGNANIANIAYSVDGANVSGTVANATFALDAGNANIANIAYSVDAANVSGLGNIATINLDGNVSNLLTGNGTFVAIPTSTANANYANFAGDVVNSAQPNITSVGTLTALTANTTTPINLSATDGNLTLLANNNSNISGTRLSFVYNNPVSNIGSIFGAQESGFDLYMANTAAGNVGTGNIRSYWQFLTDGTFRHTIGGTGNIIAKNIILGNVFTGQYNGNIVAGNGNLNVGNITLANAGIYTGNAAGLTNIPGANVTGFVPNANIANTAYSVAAANVSGLGNIAVINLDGNASNFLDGTGNFVTTPAAANANYANFAGDVVNSAQPNITSVGNLVALNIDANIANSTTIQTNGNLISYAGSNYYSVTTAYNAGSGIGARGSQAIVLVDGNDFEYSRNDYYLNKSGTAKMAYSEVSIDNSIIGNGGTDPLVPGAVGWTAYTSSSNLANINTNTGFGFNVGGGGLNILTGAPINNPAISLSVYGNSANGTGQQGIRFRRRNGNADSRTNVGANYYLGNIEWQGASTATGGFNANATIARVAAKVESTYANTGPIPTALEFQVSNGTTSTHNFHANGDVSFSKSITANLVTGTLTTAAQPNITSVGTLSSLSVTGNVTSGNLAVSGNLSLNTNSSSSAIAVIQEGNGGISAYQMFNDTSVFSVQSFYRTRGNSATRTAVSSNDTIFTQNYSVYGDSGNTFVNVGYQENKVGTNYGNGQVSLTSTFAASYAGSQFSITGYDNINLNGNIVTPNDINVNSSNVVIGANGRLAYLRTFGSFTSNATQTSNGANTTNYMTLNNTEDANGISIASSTQITVARPGRYNIQFSAQLEKTDSGSDTIEIWLDKNGTAVANTATQILLAGNNAKSVAAWDFNVNAANVNDYFRLAWASPDTDVQITAVPAANTISGVAIPSVIVDINPIGA
jgi:hypothetical protein